MRAELATLIVLWRRDLLLSGRRLALGLLAPGLALAGWAVLTFGLAAAEARPALGRSLFPGFVTLGVLLAAVFANADRRADRRRGFLRLALVGPASAATIALGTVVGAAQLTLLAGACVIALAPLAGFSLGSCQWPLLLGVVVLLSVAASALTAAIAFAGHRPQSYSLVAGAGALLVWLGSGALVPATATGWGEWLLRLNPLAPATALLGAALGGEPTPAATLAWALGGLVVVIGGGLALATWTCRQTED